MCIESLESSSTSLRMHPKQPGAVGVGPAACTKPGLRGSSVRGPRL